MRSEGRARDHRQFRNLEAKRCPSQVQLHPWNFEYIGQCASKFQDLEAFCPEIVVNVSLKVKLVDPPSGARNPRR